MSGTLFSPWAKGGAFRDVARHTAKLFGCPEPADALDDKGLASSEAMMHCLQGVDAINLTSTLMDHAVRTLLAPAVACSFPFRSLPDISHSTLFCCT